MPEFERIVEIEHPIGEGGALRLRGIDGRASLRGVDGDTARVRVRYRVRAATESAAERAIEDARARVDRGAGRLELDARDRRWGPFEAVSWLFGEGHVRVDFEAELPRDAAARVETVSGDVAASDLRGEQRYTTVSGRLDVEAGGGRIEADTVAGRIDVAAKEPLSLSGRSVSGSIRALAPRFGALRVATTSGSIELDGTLAPGVDHRVETVSGTLRLGAPGGVTIEARTISGRVRAERDARVDGVSGGRRVVLGDGSARLRFHSMSGGLDVSSSGWRSAFPAADTSPATDPTPAADPTPAGLAPQATSSGADGGGEETRGADPRLAILQALERGEIGVDEAASRLASAAAAPPEASRA